MKFLREFKEYMSGRPTNGLFVEWGAVHLISAAAQRQIWIISRESEVYPNFFTLLVGPPGNGKSSLIAQCASILQDAIDPRHRMPDATTMQSILDQASKAKISFDHPLHGPIETSPQVGTFDEISNLIRPGESNIRDLMNTLFNCSDQSYEYKTKNKSNASLPRPFLTFLGGTPAAALKDILPAQAFNSGFTARTMLIYGPKLKTLPAVLPVEGASAPTAMPSEKKILRGRLVDYLKEINETVGGFTIESNALKSLNEWLEDGLEPKIKDPRFEYYNDRRLLHLIKLMMIMSLMDSIALVIRLCHFEAAKDLLLRSEATMTRAVAFITNNEQQHVIELLKRWCFANASPERRYIPMEKVHCYLNKLALPRDQWLILKSFMDQGYGALAGKDLNGRAINLSPSDKLFTEVADTHPDPKEVEKMRREGRPPAKKRRRRKPRPT